MKHLRRFGRALMYGVLSAVCVAVGLLGAFGVVILVKALAAFCGPMVGAMAGFCMVVFTVVFLAVLLQEVVS